MHESEPIKRLSEGRRSPPLESDSGRHEGGPTQMLMLFTNARFAIANAIEREDGQGLTEYALILTLIAVVAIAALTFFGTGVATKLSVVGTSVAGAI